MAVSFDRLHPVEPSPEARRLLWQVLSVGVVTRDEAERRGAHDQPGAFLFWVSSGKATLEVGERSFHLRPGPRCWLLDLRQSRNYIPAPGRRLVTNGLRFASFGSWPRPGRCEAPRRSGPPTWLAEPPKHFGSIHIPRRGAA